MKESVVYQKIFNEGWAEGWAEGLAEGRAEGRLEAMRSVILEFAEERFGTNADAKKFLEKIDSGDCLDRICQRLVLALDWDDLLRTPSKGLR